MNLLIERPGLENDIVIIKLNRPTMLHAFNTETAKELVALLQTLKEDRSVRVVILTSTTEDAFCTGADLKERKDMSDEDWKAQHALFEEMFYALEDLPQPTIAAVNGYALAGGFELALCCDLLFAGSNATFGLPEVVRGIMPGGGGSRLLPKRIPLHIAKEWLFTGRLVSVQMAEEVGLLNGVVKPEKLMSSVLTLAQTIAKNAPLGVQATKRVANESYALSIEESRTFEIDQYNAVITSEDRLEGIRAFNEKRKPNFIGS